MRNFTMYLDVIVLPFPSRKGVIAFSLRTACEVCPKDHVRGGRRRIGPAVHRALGSGRAGGRGWLTGTALAQAGQWKSLKEQDSLISLIQHLTTEPSASGTVLDVRRGFSRAEALIREHIAAKREDPDTETELQRSGARDAVGGGGGRVR